MKCTNKEQETCNVEKMGCRGCYYNQMNLDEAIEVMKSYINSPFNYIDVIWKDYFELETAMETVIKEIEKERK